MSTHPHLHEPHTHGESCGHNHTPGGRWADRIGVISTAICAVHCMLTPVYTILKTIALPEWVEWIDWLILPLSIFGVLHLVRHFQEKKWKVFIWVGWTLMAFGTVIEHIYHLAFVVALIGAGMLLWAYIRHLRSTS